MPGHPYTVTGAAISSAASYSWQVISGFGLLTDAGTLTPTYTPTAVETGDVVLSLNVAGLSTCGPVADQVTIHILPMVTATAGPDNTVCQNSTFTVTSATASHYSSVLWTTSGTGTLIDAGTLTPIYQPGAGETGPVVFTLTANGNSPCGSVTSQFTLTVNPPANANAGPPHVICEGSTFTVSGSIADNASSLLWTKSGTGNFDNATILHPTYTPSAADILAGNVTLTLTATGLTACAPANGSVLLGISKQVAVNAGPDGMVCQNTAFPITLASELHSTSLNWSHNGTGTLLNAGTINPSYIPGPGESGVVTLTLTGDPISPCGAATDQMQITVHPLPVADAGPSGTSCQGNNYPVVGATAQFYNSVAWTEDGPGALVNSNTLTPTYIPLPGETGTVTLTLTAHGSNTCSAEIFVSTRTLVIHPLPDINAGTDATICAANTLNVAGAQQFTSSLQWTSSGDGAFANPSLLTTIYTPGANDILAGTVMLTLTGGGSGACSSVNDVDQLSLTIDPMPAINAGPDGAFCVTNPITLTGTSAVHNSSLQWISSGDGNYNSTTILSPTYMPGNIDFFNGTVTLTLKAFGLLSCAAQSVTDTRVLSVSAYPIVNAGPDDYICSNITQYQMNGVGNNYNTGNIQWTFTGGDGFLSNPNVINPVYHPGPVDLSTVNRNITFTLTIQGTGNCSGVFINDQVVLKIDPTPISNAGPDDENCGRNPYQLTASAQFQSIITWTTSGDGTFSNAGILNPIYIPGPTDVGKTVVLTLDLSGCKSIIGDDFLWLNVHPDPGANIMGTTSICEGSTTPVSISFTGTPPWSVTYTNGTTPVTVNNILSTPYTFDVNPALTTNWWITASSDAYCTAPADSIDGLVAVTVFPLPDKFSATVTNNGVFCEGTEGVHVGLNSSQIGMNYELWRNGSTTGTIRPGTGNPLDFGLVNIPGQYYVRGINPSGSCIAMMNDTLNVIMNPIPVTDFTASVPCLGDTTIFSVTGDYIASTSYWQWDFGDGKFQTFNAPTNPKHLYPTPGIYTVKLNVGDTNSCLYMVSHQIEVRPHPVAFFSHNTPNCLGSAVELTDLSSNLPTQGYINQWIWTYGDGSPADTIYFPDSPNKQHNYANEGTYLVTLSVLNSRNCSDTYAATINVTKPPVADFTFISGCEEAAAFSDLTIENGGGQVVNWQWNFGDPGAGTNNFSGLQNPVHSYTESGSFPVKLVVTNLNGCTDTIQRPVNVKTKPISNFFSSPGCLSSATLFTADSTLINNSTTANYHWNFGDGFTDNGVHVLHTYLAPGTYTVTLTITDTAGCVGDTSHTVTVHPAPVAHFSTTTDNCQGEDVSFADQSTTLNGFINKWIWNFGDGNTQTVNFPSTPNVSHTYTNPGIYSVTLTVMNSEGCTQWESNPINVLGAPNSDFISSGQCAGTQVLFTDISTVSGTIAISKWDWTFGDVTSGVNNTSTAQHPIHTFANPGSYIVKLITTSGNNCSDTITKTVTIKPIPPVDFNAQGACASSPASFAPAGVAVASISGWYWTFGDGGTSNAQAPTHSYSSSGTYTVTLTITDTAGCSNTRSKPVIIAPLPDANFGFSTPTCKGDAVHFSDFSTTASGYVARWSWDFGDGNIQNIVFPATPDVNHQYINSGTFNVTLTVKTNDSCINQITRVVTILAKPTADFVHGAACQGNAVSFSDQSISNTTGSISGWAWNFGDPSTGTANNSTLQNPTHIYNAAGTYTVALITSIPGGCSDTVTHQLTVSPPPPVDFTPVAGCNADTTKFTSSTLVNMATTQGWYWQFGDGGTSFIADPVHIYATAGTYSVVLTITDTAGCTNTKVKPVTVVPGPVAAFSSSTPGCSDLPITFTDLSTSNGGSLTTWHWIFGDGSDTTFNASVPTFAHTYTQPGTFQASLHVFSALGCENTIQHAVTISPSPVAAFDYANTCQGQSTQFTDMTSLNGGSSLTQRLWDFGDPASGILNTSTSANPIHNYALAGQYPVKLITLNAGGCADTVQQILSITPKPGVDFYSDSLLCLGSITTLFTDTLLTNTGIIGYYEWDFGDGSLHAYTQNASHQYNFSGTFNVTLTIQDSSGCENAITRPLTIHTAPVSAFTYDGKCEDTPTQFTDLSVAPLGDTIVHWYWEFFTGPTADTSTLKNPTYTFAQPGTYTIKLTTFTENGCSNTKILPVQIWNRPTAYFQYTASPCENGLVEFRDSSWSYQGLVNSWQWEFEPYQYGSGNNPNHLYYAIDSCYEVKLMIEDLRGCVDTVIQQVCVPAKLTVDFNTSLSCFGDPVTFSPQLLTPSAQADSLVSFNWNFSDPAAGTGNVSTQKNPAHAFSSVGYYTVSFTTTDKFGCSATKYKTVKVNAIPVAGFSYSAGQCDSTLIFTSTSTDPGSTINTYIWQYGDGTSDTLFTATATSHQYSIPGEYQASLTVINDNGCRSTHTGPVIRSACIEAAAMSSQSQICQNYDLSFADISTCDGTITQWKWNFGDGTPTLTYGTYKPAVNHTFTNPGTYTISLKVSTQVGTSTISDSTTLDIEVKPSPLAGFTVDPVCLGVNTEFSDTTDANGATVLFYHWEFGEAEASDTSNLQNPEYPYSAAGLYSPTLVVRNLTGCADTATAEVMVNGLPDALYANSLACTGQKTYFFDASQPYMVPLAAWGWRVNDSLGSIGSMQGSSPYYEFDSAGSYQVMLTVADSNGCVDSIVQQVLVYPAPVSAFSYTENVDDIQGQIQFNNGSIGAEEYYWDFGNGETSFKQSPIITYSEDGVYQVKLATVNEQGCHDTAMISYEMIFKGLYVPNAMAPGGTIQATRIWKPVGVNLASYIAEIYNSQGMLLWKSDVLDEKGSPAESWDGSYNEKPCQQDVYVWKITAIFRDGSVWENQDVGERKGLSDPVYGTVTIIR